jgi:CDP-glucose 4,6-dehydratase
MLSSNKLAKAFSGKVVLVTGHTGFKGSWLTAWLQRLGARVIGLSVDIPTEPSHFTELGLVAEIDDRRMDIRNAEAVAGLVAEVEPDFVFHLAAQPLVRRSYRLPLETFATNAMGTCNLLEALRLSQHPCTVVLITSDKCYDNVEWVWGYRETDRLGGKDPYSGSKGAAELVIRSYHASFFGAADSQIRVAVGRAGNVVGGGDWAEDRIVPDCIRAWSEDRTVEVRNPDATRPWQHVLEPLSGYLWLGILLREQAALNGEAFNFGPPLVQDHSVGDVITALAGAWSGEARYEIARPAGGVAEAGLLKLNCDKAFADLKWRPTLDFQEMIELTGQWYDAYYRQDRRESVLALTHSQIERYENLARTRGIGWACD